MVINDITKRLEKAGIESPSANAETILMDILNCRCIDLYTKEVDLSERQRIQLQDALESRIDGKPLQHITGRTCFFGNDLIIKPGVFIPRPETEVLVNVVLDIARNHKSESLVKIHDLCTGSGNVAISLTKSITRCKIISSDISDMALWLAKENADRHNVSDRIEFKKSDLFKDLTDCKNVFDIIVSNPPYISTNTINNLGQEIRREPLLALDGGKEGLDFYIRIIKESPLFLKRGGFLALELGDDSSQGVKKLFKESKTFCNIKVFKDFNDIERVITAQLNTND